MKNLRMEHAALALMMAAAMMLSAGQAEAKKKSAARAETPPQKLSTESVGGPIHYPEDPGGGYRWWMSIERETLWGAVRHLYWV